MYVTLFNALYVQLDCYCHNSSGVARVVGNLKLVMIQSSHRFGLAREETNLSESSLAVWALRARVASPNGPRVSAAKPRTGTYPAKLDSDKLGDEAARTNRWLD